MLIYKNVKDNKCNLKYDAKDNKCNNKSNAKDNKCNNTFEDCNKALDPDDDNNSFLKFERCINMTFEEFKNKDYINNNIYCETFDSTIDNIKSNIKSKLKNISLINAYNSKLPLPVYIMIAKKIEYDPNDANANTIKTFLNNIGNSDLVNELNRVKDDFKKTSLIKYTFQGNYKIVIFIPNIMPIPNSNHYCYLPSLESCSRCNRWINYVVNKNSKYLKAIKNDTDYTKEVIEKVGEEKYWSMTSQERYKKYGRNINKQNKKNWKNDFLYYELEKTCDNMGCVSDEGEDLEELVPLYSTDGAEMDKNSKKKSPYYPSKCLQTRNYKDYMFDDSGVGDDDAIKKKEDYIKEAIDIMEEKYKSDKKAKEEIDKGKTPKGDYFSGTFDSLIKTSVSEARSEIYKKPGMKAHEYSKEFNNNILKDIARRYKKYPGVPEITFRVYKLDENNNEFKSMLHYMPWGNILLTKQYVLNDGDILRLDDIEVTRSGNISKKQVSFKSFNNQFEMKINNNSRLALYRNGKEFKLVSGANNINLANHRDRFLKYELNNLNIYGINSRNKLENIGTIQIEIINPDARLPNSLILNPRNGEIVIYDLGYNVAN